MDNALASQALMPLLGMAEDESIARVITVVVLVVQAVLVIASTRLPGLFTSGAVAVELAIVAILVDALAVVMVVTGSGHLGNLGSAGIAAGAPNYWAIGGGVMAATAHRSPRSSATNWDRLPNESCWCASCSRCSVPAWS